jgi:hypothetical protein
MAEYRVCLIDTDGQLESSRAFSCDTDTDAIEWAKQMAGNRPAELWRKVERLTASDEQQAVSHEVQEGRLVPKER